MTRKTAVLIAAAAATLTPGHATAQYGRLVPPQKVLALHAAACAAGSTDFETSLPKLARRRGWDEYGRSATARPGDRAWLVSLDGQPAIVDISKQGRSQRCSVNAVTGPAGLLSLVRAQRGRAPDRVTRKGTSGDVSLWRLTPRTTVSVTVPMGQAIGRITTEVAR